MTTPQTPAAVRAPAADDESIGALINAPGAIQPHGVLLALDDRMVVVTASANTGAMLGVEAARLLGAHLRDVAGAGLGDLVERRVAAGFPTDPLVVALDQVGHGSLAGRDVDVGVHAAGARVVVDLEEVVGSAGTSVSYRSARSAMGRLTQVGSVESLTAALADEVRELTAFDRVMVYRFDESWNGEVVAEARRADLDPRLGVHFPAGDIPSSARRLHLLNPVRLIADVGCTPVALVPDDDPDGPLDLSLSGLRGISPVHVEFLSIMGVTASMSVSIVIDDRLWGLVACHHYSGPHRPSQDARAAAEFVTQVASHLVAHRERADARDAAVATHTELAALTSRLSAADGDVLDALFAEPDLLDLVGATGAALFFDGTLRTAGRVPDAALLQRIADLLNEPEEYLASTSNLAALDPELAALADVASGVLRIGTLGDRWGMWFRPERAPVERWQAAMSGHSAPWQPWHLEAAEELGQRINSLLLLRSREQVAMAESMQRAVVLDRAPAFDGADLVARYRPASTYQLGGDWWDAFELPDHRLAFVVGDVAGHGVAAASAMTQVRTALRAYLYEGHPAAECLDRLDLLIDGLLGVGVATAVVALLDPDTGAVEIANAGHPCPMLVAASGGAVEVPMEVRPLLGVGMGSAPTTRLDLPVGDTLLLFTDGLVERRGHDMGERTARLADLAGSRAADEDPEAWADRILAVLDTTDDDTTLLAIRRT